MVDAPYQSLPRLRFNKDGNLLAVTTADGGLKVLANTDGMKYLKAIEARSYEASKAAVETKVYFICIKSLSSPSSSLISLLIL